VLELACDPDELPKIAKVKNLGVSNQDFVFFDILWFGKDSIINI
jgi:predicted oxidoreductase